ncbi:MAG: beta-lactamase family protein, partial [Treponema sp.]|nr:beta-lactamase family protein [Treponema sp.]
MSRLFSIIAVSICLHLSTVVFAIEFSRTLDTVNTYLEQNFPNTHMPSMSIIIVDSDSVLYSRSFGDCDSADTPFIIGSMSKSFTAFAIMQLAEQGKINLDNSITDYIQADLDDKVTIRHLLNHSSGFNRYQTLGNLTVHDHFGSYNYSNLNYTLLGVIIETVTGLSYGEYLRINIFEPLSLSNSFTSLYEAEGIATGHRNLFGIPVKKEFPYPVDGDLNSYVSVPTGYIISSSADMGRYLQVFLRNGEGLLSPESVDSLLLDSVPIPSTNERYAMGWQETTDYEERLFYHSGLVENYFSIMCLLPDSGLGVVTLYNMNDYFVANNLATTLTIDVLNILMGVEPAGVGKNDYFLFHLLINLLLCFALLLAIIPLLRLCRWKEKLAVRRPLSLITGSAALHIL